MPRQHVKVVFLQKSSTESLFRRHNMSGSIHGRREPTRSTGIFGVVSIGPVREAAHGFSSEKGALRDNSNGCVADHGVSLEKGSNRNAGRLGHVVKDKFGRARGRVMTGPHGIDDKIDWVVNG